MVLLFGTCYCSLVIFREVFLRTKFTENPRIKFAQQALLLMLVTRRFVFLCIATKRKIPPIFQAGFFSQLILNHTKLFLVVFLFLFLSLRSSFFLNFKSQLVQLCFAYALRCLSHQTRCIFYLRECNYVTNAVNLGNEHNQTVKTVS